MQTEFLGIFDKFPNIPLMEVGNGWPTGGDSGQRPDGGGGSGGGWLVDGDDGRWWWMVDRRQVAFSGDRGIFVFSLRQIFASHGNVGFPWGEVGMF